MRVLMVLHAPPCPPDFGAARRNHYLLAEALKRHDVTVLCLGTAEQHEAFKRTFGARQIESVFVPRPQAKPSKIARCAWYMATGRSDYHRLYRRRFQRALDDLLARHRFDLAFFSTTMLGCYRLPSHIPLVGDSHNVEHDALLRASREAPEAWRRAYFRAQWRLTRREEIAYASRFSIVCATSERDRGLLSSVVRVPVTVIPNGVDVQTLRRHRARLPQPGLVLFTGLMSYYPNEHGVRRFVERVLPHVTTRVPHVRFRIVGADPSAAIRALSSPVVDVKGWVDDVKPHYAEAEVCAIPLWIGGGTRIKALEAMAMGVPVVSTRLGCEGLDVRDGRSAMFGDTDVGLAEALIRVLTQPALRRSLAEQALTVAEDYDWRRIGLALHGVFKRAAAGASGARPVSAANPSEFGESMLPAGP